MLMHALMAAQGLTCSHMQLLADCIQARHRATSWLFKYRLDSYAPCALQVYAADDRLSNQGTGD